MHPDAGTVFYRLLRAVAGPPFRAYFRIRVTGRNLVPSTGPFLVAANHQSYLDPLVIGATCPRPVHFMMARAFWRKPVIGWASRRLGSFPVEEGRILPGTLRRALGLLEAGAVVGIFPEGRITPDGRLGPGRPGVALLALRAGVPVVPAAIAGTRRAFPKGRLVPRPARVTVRYGAPLDPPRAAGEDDPDPEGFSALVMAGIAALGAGEPGG